MGLYKKRGPLRIQRGTASHTKVPFEFGVVLGRWPKQTKLTWLLVTLKEGQRKKCVSEVNVET